MPASKKDNVVIIDVPFIDQVKEEIQRFLRNLDNLNTLVVETDKDTPIRPNNPTVVFVRRASKDVVMRMNYLHSRLVGTEE